MQKFNINGKEVWFDSASHTYTVDNNKVISVTQMLKHKFPTKYSGVSKAVLKRAADKGTELHNAIEVYEIYGLERDDLEEFRNYLFLKDKFKFEVVQSEVPVMLEYKDIYVCGRLDQLQYVNGEYGLADIKRTSSLDKDYLTYQLNLYRLAYQQNYSDKIKFLKGIHLREDKRKYIDIPINEKIVYELLEDYKKTLGGK